ncbi:MAG: aspartate-semialdehyde dehydrogenase [Clostridia bacterium]|nr:aspartate-semialdehyde dehydrogenase [Clostridia bacterium]
MKVGILGATGAVGSEMLNSLVEQNIKVDELKLFASGKSAGKLVDFKGEKIAIEEAKEDCFKGLDIVLGASANPVAKRFASNIVDNGAVFIDNSSAFRLYDDVPLIVPEINGEDAKKHKGIIANPNCSTIITCMAVYPIAKLSKITKMITSTYQAVSGAGAEGITELEEEIELLKAGKPLSPKVFPYQIAYNCIPQIGGKYDDDLYTTEEMKMENEGRKIMHLPELMVTCTCVRVPVFRSHCISVSLQTERDLSVCEVREAIKNFRNVQLKDELDDGIYPMPLETSNQNDVFVGRIRKDRVLDNGIALFCCGDQIRKGAAANAVQIINCL